MVGINVIGYVSAHCGLGAAARTTLHILTGRGYKVSVMDLVLSGNRSGRDHSFDHLMCPANSPLPGMVHLFHCNPPIIGEVRKKLIASDGESSHLKVAVPFWELPVIPDTWLADLSAMDMVLCPSRFIEQAISTAPLDPMPLCRHYPQTVFLPKHHRPDRARFGLPENSVCFIVSFELASDMERKNPWAAIDAFNIAFGNQVDVRLVIKLNNSGISDRVRALREWLQGYVATNDRIIIIDKSMDESEVISLYESCDVFVSLHRSEGLGLSLMEAMHLGKPVIATGWSGNMDFMDDVNACLVGYRLVPVVSPVYRALLREKQAFWADPDIAEAVWWMRRLYDNPGERAEKGRLARQRMQRYHVECLEGAPFCAVEERYRVVKARSAGEGFLPNEHMKVWPIADPGALVHTVSALMKRNDASGALAVYYRSRGLLHETPELLRLDEVMLRLRQTVQGYSC